LIRSFPALFGLWEVIRAPGVGFVSFVKSFSSPYATGVVLFALLAIESGDYLQLAAPAGRRPPERRPLPRGRHQPEDTPQNPCGTRPLDADHLCLKLAAFERISSRPTEEG
jgi:hypothetical protein